MLAFAQAGAAKIEAQHGESEAVERLHGVKDDFVVQRSAVQRMRMANEGGMRCAGRTGVEQGFQASGGAGEEEGADGWRFRRHGMRCTTLVVSRWSLVFVASNRLDQRLATSDRRLLRFSCMDCSR